MPFKIHHEIIPEYLKTVASFLLIKPLPYAHHCNLDYFLDPHYKFLVALLRLFENGTEIIKGELIARLILSVVLIELLHCVVG
jgi:hypothetical protein